MIHGKHLLLRRHHLYMQLETELVFFWDIAKPAPTARDIVPATIGTEPINPTL